MMESGLTDDNLNHQTRGRQKKKLSRDERTEKSDKPTEAAPTVSIALAKAKAETDTWKVKCQYLQEKIEDLTKDRDFLRQQLSEAIKMDNNIPDRIKDKPADIPKRMKIDSESDSTDSDSSESSDSESSSSDSSREKKKRKKKGKKAKKRVKKQKKKQANE
ncbi:coiled-coil domain-containing protein 106-like [Carassius carassius]|uniref:coiled-coil domain-containing protein 106-like n=1 Tax=Carassius carassius TaxID=217509 RepID=UPI0028697512|nr:coiled-coil domain-containing protein 106-like [Carassius carassius]XP_059420350.1 coiled-coil domain-containing protein 106-like [Carassius carassius]